MSFRDFLQELHHAGLLREVNEATSPFIDVSDRAWGAGPIIFGNVNGRKCCLNILGTRSLLARALGIQAKDMIRHLSNVGFRGHIREVNSLPFQEIISEPDLSRLPILTYFKGDGGPYITSGVVVTQYKERFNASVHRLMVIGKNMVAIRLVPGRHTYQLYQEAQACGEDLPIAIAIGVDPLVLMAASTRVPPNMEFQYASALQGKPIEVLRLDNGVHVPNAEIVLEGHITRERAREGPFVDITGTFDLIRQEPIVKLGKMMTREDPIYHGLLPAGGEHKMLMGVPYEPLIFSAVSKVAKVKDVLLTEGGCCYFHAIVQIEKTSEEDARKVIEATFQAHGSLKHVVVVDSDIDIHNPSDVEFAIATRFRGDEDVVLYPNVRGSTLDPRSIEGMTTKVGINATARLDKLWKFQRVIPRG